MEKISKEKKGIYNVTYNDKIATPINIDIEAVENAVNQKMEFKNPKVAEYYKNLATKKEANTNQKPATNTQKPKF